MGRAPGDSSPAPTPGLACSPVRVTTEAACPLPSQGWAAVGGAGVKTPGLGPSTLGCGLVTPIPQAPREACRSHWAWWGRLCPGTRPVLGLRELARTGYRSLLSPHMAPFQRPAPPQARP